MNSDKLKQAVQLFKAGNKQAAATILNEIVRVEPRNESAWLWLYACADSAQKKETYLRKALEINPNNKDARNALEKLSPKVSAPAQSSLTFEQSLIQEQRAKKKKSFAIKMPSNKKLLSYIGLGAIALIGVSAIVFLGARIIALKNDLQTGLIQPTAVLQTEPKIVRVETSMSLAVEPTKPVSVETVQPGLIVPTQPSPVEWLSAANGYLAAIEKQDWPVARDYLCGQLASDFPTAEEFANRILFEVGANPFPVFHQALTVPGRLGIVASNLSAGNWMGGPYEMRLVNENLTWKVCGVGLENADPGYLLLPGVEALDISY